MKKLTLLLILAIASTALFAQKDVSHFMTMTKGYSFINSDDLSSITPSDAKGVGNSYLTSTLNLRTHINKCIIGVEATMARDTRSFADMFRDNDDHATIGANIYSASLQFGYAVLDKPNLKLYPIVGIGMGQSKAKIERQQDIDASQITDGELPGTSFDLSQRNFNSDFAVGFDYIIPCKKKDECNTDRKYGFVVGAKAGYRLAFGDFGWEHSGGDVNGAAQFNPSGFYAGLTLGFTKSSKGGMFQKLSNK